MVVSLTVLVSMASMLNVRVPKSLAGSWRFPVDFAGLSWGGDISSAAVTACGRNSSILGLQLERP